jgi:hypothetical protein
MSRREFDADVLWLVAGESGPVACTIGSIRPPVPVVDSSEQ